MSKKYTDSKITESTGLHREIVNSLPSTGDNSIIYMVLDPNASSPDVYDEWLWVNGTYEHIGSTRVDLTDYYNKTQIDAALSGKANTSDIPTALSGLSDDSTHRLVTDAEKTTWNGKANSATSLAGYGITNAYTKTEVDTALSGKSGIVMVEKLSVTSMASIPKGGISSIEKTATKQGYTPIGIVGVYLNKPSWQQYYPYLAIAGSYVYKSGNNYYAEVLLYNPTGSDANCTGDIYVLYVKN